MNIELQFADDERLEKISLAVLKLEGIEWRRAAELVPEALRDEVVQSARDAGVEAFGARIKAVRDMLRNGRYKPAGRAKPSSEYLLGAALEGNFPRVNPLVDAVNLASLKYLYPMSIFDADRAGPTLLCRLGAPGERYVFNSTGQEIDVEDLVCLCALEPAFSVESAAKGCAPDAVAPAIVAGSPPSPTPRPLGRPIVNPVRDSMATKLFEGARNAVIAIYAPGGALGDQGGDLGAAAKDLVQWCGRACGRVDIRFASLS